MSTHRTRPIPNARGVRPSRASVSVPVAGVGEFGALAAVVSKGKYLYGKIGVAVYSVPGVRAPSPKITEKLAPRSDLVAASI